MHPWLARDRSDFLNVPRKPGNIYDGAEMDSRPMTGDVFLSHQESDDTDVTEVEVKVEVEVEGVDDLDLSNNGQTGGVGSNTIPRVLKVNQIDSDGVDADY